MAKTESKACNFRLRYDVVGMLDGLSSQWGLSQTGAVERAIAEAHERITIGESNGGGWVNSSGFDPTTIPGVSRGVPVQGKEAEAVHEKAFRVMCQHCGVKFGAESRKETTCEPCAQKGHKGSRYDCEECRLES